MSYYGSAYFVGGTSSTADAVPLPLEGKALLRIKILCQHNKSKAKSNFDHRNSYFAATAAPQGATIGMQASRQCSPQARQPLPAGTAAFTVCVKMNSDHQNSFSRQYSP